MLGRRTARLDHLCGARQRRQAGRRHPDRRRQRAAPSARGQGRRRAHARDRGRRGLGSQGIEPAGCARERASPDREGSRRSALRTLAARGFHRALIRPRPGRCRAGPARHGRKRRTPAADCQAREARGGGAARRDRAGVRWADGGARRSGGRDPARAGAAGAEARRSPGAPARTPGHRGDADAGVHDRALAPDAGRGLGRRERGAGWRRRRDALGRDQHRRQSRARRIHHGAPDRRRRNRLGRRAFTRRPASRRSQSVRYAGCDRARRGAGGERRAGTRAGRVYAERRDRAPRGATPAGHSAARVHHRTRGAQPAGAHLGGRDVRGSTRRSHRRHDLAGESRHAGIEAWSARRTRGGGGRNTGGRERDHEHAARPRARGADRRRRNYFSRTKRPVNRPSSATIR